LVRIILNLIKFLQLTAWYVQLVKLVIREAFLAFKGDVLLDFIVQILKIQRFNKHVRRVIFVLKEFKYIRNAHLVTISHLNINRLALNVLLDSFAHRLTLQYLLYVLKDLTALQELKHP
jgi:hypothetical protein